MAGTIGAAGNKLRPRVAQLATRHLFEATDALVHVRWAENSERMPRLAIIEETVCRSVGVSRAATPLSSFFSRPKKRQGVVR